MSFTGSARLDHLPGRGCAFDVAYRKTGLEWEILGDLGLRLHHKEEAKEAYQRCLASARYAQKP